MLKEGAGRTRRSDCRCDYSSEFNSISQCIYHPEGQVNKGSSPGYATVIHRVLTHVGRSWKMRRRSNSIVNRGVLRRVRAVKGGDRSNMRECVLHPHFRLTCSLQSHPALFCLCPNLLHAEWWRQITTIIRKVCARPCVCVVKGSEGGTSDSIRRRFSFSRPTSPSVSADHPAPGN